MSAQRYEEAAWKTLNLFSVARKRNSLILGILLQTMVVKCSMRAWSGAAIDGGCTLLDRQADMAPRKFSALHSIPARPSPRLAGNLLEVKSEN
jgi:hypothetical protein